MKELWAVKTKKGNYVTRDTMLTVSCLDMGLWFTSRREASKYALYKLGDTIVSVDAERERIANRRAA
jgi:hypothetical protein